MTIKEVEQLLEIPRATVRFYEKEGLVCPGRGGNGYRNYTDEDIEKLRKIIILRKIGMSLEDINDVFDGERSLREVLDTNIIKLRRQMDELKGAMILCEKMKEEEAEIVSLDTDRYWGKIEEEEKQGNLFIDIAKDIADMEKGVVSSYFFWTDENGKPYDSLTKRMRNMIIVIVLAGCLVCMMEREWTLHNFLDGFTGILKIMLVEVVLSVPLYFIGKKIPWVRNNRNKVLIGTCVGLILLLLLLANLFGI